MLQNAIIRAVSPKREKGNGASSQQLQSNQKVIINTS
jgi:hypothetical protein